MKNYCRKLLLLAMLMASLLCFTLTIFAQSKGSAAKGKVTDASAKATKEATQTIRFAKGSKVALAAGHRYVRLGPNQTAVYKGKDNTGVTLECLCGNVSQGDCSMTIISANILACTANGCKLCEMSATLPPSQAAILREMKAAPNKIEPEAGKQR
jgi:hypothetical protein